MRFLFAALVLTLLTGCAGLPPPSSAANKYVVVYFKHGTASLSVFKNATFGITAGGSRKPFNLRSGLNYIPIDSAAETASVASYTATSELNKTTHTLFSAYVGAQAVFPGANSIALAAFVLSYHEDKVGTGYVLRGDVTPMTDEMAQSIIDGWKKEKTAAQWSSFSVAKD